MPYYYEPSAGGRPDYGFMRRDRQEPADRYSWYAWLEDAMSSLGSIFRRTSAEPVRSLTPPPVRSQFKSAEAFREERAHWFREHGDGSELQGSWTEQHVRYDRLRDARLGKRRERANPSGTPRPSRGSSSAAGGELDLD